MDSNNSTVSKEINAIDKNNFESDDGNSFPPENMDFSIEILRTDWEVYLSSDDENLLSGLEENYICSDTANYNAIDPLPLDKGKKRNNNQEAKVLTKKILCTSESWRKNVIK